MDELSDEVKAFLARAQRGHDVPRADVKQRVRAGVATALTLPAVAAPGPLHELGVQTGLGKTVASWSLGAKLGAAALAVSVVGAASLLVPRLAQVAPSPSHVASQARSADSQVVAKSSVVDSAAVPTRTALTNEPSLAAASPVAPTAPASLDDTRAAPQVVDADADATRTELSLLLAASDALDHGDSARGLTLLAQHRTRFPDSALDQERHGLSLVARCLERAPQGASDARAHGDAKAFLKRFPSAVLTTRIRRACELE